MIIPPATNHGIDNPALVRRNVTVEEGPDMVATEGRALFDKQNFQVRSLRQSFRGETTCKAATSNDHPGHFTMTRLLERAKA